MIYNCNHFPVLVSSCRVCRRDDEGLQNGVRVAAVWIRCGDDRVRIVLEARLQQIYKVMVSLIHVKQGSNLGIGPPKCVKPELNQFLSSLNRLLIVKRESRSIEDEFFPFSNLWQF